MGSLTARLATLVTIILGEGLNGITGTLKFAATSLGFNFRCVALVLCTAVVLPFTFTSKARDPELARTVDPYGFASIYPICSAETNNKVQPLNILQILYTSLEFTITKFTTFLNDANQGDPSQMIDTLNKTMTPFLAKIGFSWDDGWKHVMETAGSGTQDEFETFLWEFESDDQSPATELAILQYLRNDSVIHRDVLDVNLPEFGKVLTTMAEPHVQGARWINALAGGALICLALINITQSWPKDRYAWGSAISRFLNGTILLTLLFMNVDSGDYSMASSDGAIWAWLDSFWALPTLAFSLLAQAIVDHMLLVLAVRSADRALQRTYEPSMLDPLRDSKDHAYDPPQPSGASIATTYPPTPGTGGYKNTQSNWQPPYVPHTQQHPVYASPPEMGHQNSHGFVAPPPPPTLPFQATGGTGIPPAEL
ncbi:Bacterial low temperature requirement A protein (LtrA) [Rhizoctonia solani]|uniref:Bacterial low temperature requirement A protein (LtrA) n=1 Tax=Rhizoctonia solani TaxID=456999 RepID=A0A8H7IDA0_9AGAM|nr:Bacterial low temperature requirement A protein (LtrA) [Rhizoctonia solani]